MGSGYEIGKKYLENGYRLNETEDNLGSHALLLMKAPYFGKFKVSKFN